MKERREVKGGGGREVGKSVQCRLYRQHDIRVREAQKAVDNSMYACTKYIMMKRCITQHIH